MRQEVIASLEGARIVISEGVCELGEYDFERNCWNCPTATLATLQGAGCPVAARVEQV
jgi:hypothetical protein